jgi:hypothetical protein
MNDMTTAGAAAREQSFAEKLHQANRLDVAKHLMAGLIANAGGEGEDKLAYRAIRLTDALLAGLAK